jgi:hypothetical protein
MSFARWIWLTCALCACGGTTQADATQVAALPPGAAGDAQCGSKGQPDCPLQGWMKSTLQTYQRAKDYARLEKALSQLAEHAPEGYGEWKALAEAGLQAAHAQDETAVSKSCKACHTEYRTRFRKERRAQPLF